MRVSLRSGRVDANMRVNMRSGRVSVVSMRSSRVETKMPVNMSSYRVCISLRSGQVETNVSGRVGVCFRSGRAECC